MAMMAKMRSLAPAFIITVGALFVLFMVVSDSNVMEALGGRPNSVGSINGVDITYQEFMQSVDIQRENQKAQTGEEFDDANIDQLRDQVWEAVVTQTLFTQQIEEFGITVTDDEVRNIILGPNPPEFLKQNFIDSVGNFNRQIYEQALYDPNNRQALLNAEDYVRQTLLQEKLQSMLTASITVSEEEIKRKFVEQNIKMDAQYVFADITQFPDSIITVTDEELKSYYNNNLNKYKIVPQRKLKYVMFGNVASSDDSATVRRILESVKENFSKDTASFQEYVDIYSAVPYSKDTLNVSTLPPNAAGEFVNADKGSLVGPVASPEGYTLYHLLDKVSSNQTYVKASHILINQQENDEKNYEEAMRIYNELVEGASFEKMATQYSSDPGSAARGGDLGWFSKGRMVPAFETAAFNAPTEVVQKPVKTNYGYHIIKVTGKSNNNFVVERIVNPIKASASTIDANYNAALDFAYLAKERDFEKEAEIMNYNIQETTPFTEEAFSIPGIGANKRIIEFAFDNSINEISDPFRIQNGYVVVKVSEIINEGVKPFEEVKDLVRPQVVREKKFERSKEIIETIKSKINGDIAKAKSINPNVKVEKTGSFTPNGSITGLGRDYAFIHNALNLELNKVSEPIKGNRGYFLIKVSERSEFDKEAYESQRSSIRDNLLQTKKSTFFNQWIASLKEDADIEDNRYMFFGQ